jgi:hypothetical protein
MAELGWGWCAIKMKANSAQMELVLGNITLARKRFYLQIQLEQLELSHVDLF